LLSGKVTPHKQFRIGGNLIGSVASQPIKSLAKFSKGALEDAFNKDTVNYGTLVDNFSEGVLAYSLDPINAGFDFYLRYGISPKFDVGYKFAFGSHIFDSRYQFMGSTGTLKNPGKEGMYGSIGLQFSTQSAKIPGQVFFDQLQGLLDFGIRRRDILIPIIFSHSIGREEAIGAIAYGMVYSHTFISYRFEPDNIYKKVGNNSIRIPGISDKANFPAIGFFLNAKLGYKYVYVIPAIAVYYQNYGTYKLLEGYTVNLKGTSFIPSIGIQIHLGKQ